MRHPYPFRNAPFLLDSNSRVSSSQLGRVLVGASIRRLWVAGMSLQGICTWSWLCRGAKPFPFLGRARSLNQDSLLALKNDGVYFWGGDGYDIWMG